MKLCGVDILFENTRKNSKLNLVLIVALDLESKDLYLILRTSLNEFILMNF